MTTERKKHVALFVGGAMAWHALTHTVLALTRSKEPHSRLGIPITPVMNAVGALAWAGISVVLTRYVLKAREAGNRAQTEKDEALLSKDWAAVGRAGQPAQTTPRT